MTRMEQHARHVRQMILRNTVRLAEWQRAKAACPQAIVFIRIGGSFETYEADALTCHREGALFAWRERNTTGLRSTWPVIPAYQGPAKACMRENEVERVRAILSARGYAMALADAV